MTDPQLADVFAQMLARLDVLIAKSGSGIIAPPQNYIWSQRAETTAWEALTATLAQTPAPNERWIINRMTMHGVCAANPALAQSPVAGLFLVQAGTEVESEGEGQSAVGWNIRSRGIPLPSGVVVNSTFIASSATYAYVISLTQSTPLVISPGQTLRGVLSCNPGTLQPGPGSGSWGFLTAMGAIERTGLQ